MHPFETGPLTVRQSWEARGGGAQGGSAPGSVPARFTAGGSLRLGAQACPEAVTRAQHVAGILRGMVPGLMVTVQELAGNPGQGLRDAPGRVLAADADRALLAGEADAVVCRLADVPPPGAEPRGLVTAAFLPRDDARYCLVVPAGSSAVKLDGLPAGARVAAAGAGCAQQLSWRRGDLDVRDAGPGLAAALRLLDTGACDALVVPRAELDRAQPGRAAVTISVGVLHPPAGAGATVIRCREGNQDVAALLRLLHHPAAQACAVAEQTVAGSLPGDADPVAAVHCAVRNEDEMTLYAVMSVDGGDLAAAERAGPVSDPVRLGTLVAGALVRSAARSALFTRPRF